MSFEFTDDIRAIWFIGLSLYSNLLCVLYEDPHFARVVWRVRKFDGVGMDFEWYEMTTSLRGDAAIELGRTIYQRYRREDHRSHELLRGTQPLRQFLRALTDLGVMRECGYHCRAELN